LKAGVIGVGNMGQHHARNYFEIQGINLVALSDIEPKIGKAIAKRLWELSEEVTGVKYFYNGQNFIL